MAGSMGMGVGATEVGALPQAGSGPKSQALALDPNHLHSRHTESCTSLGTSWAHRGWGGPVATTPRSSGPTGPVFGLSG